MKLEIENLTKKFQDAVFFASCHGRDRAVAAKVWAGVGIVTAVYWMVMLIYSVALLGYLGADGWNCPVQTEQGDWKCFYHLTVWQKYVLIFLPSFLGNLESAAVSKILGLLPDRLLQVGTALGYFDLYTLGDRVMGAVPILLVLYGIGAAAVLPVVYWCFVRS